MGSTIDQKENISDGDEKKENTENDDKGTDIENIDSFKQLNIDTDKLAEIGEKVKDIIKDSANAF